MVLVLAREAAGLRKLRIHVGLARTGDGAQNAVKHDVAGVVDVEILVDHVPQEPAALRYAHCENSLVRRGGMQGIGLTGRILLGIAHKQHKIPHGCESHALDHRIRCLVKQFINGFGIESRHGVDAHVLGVDIAPVRGRELLRRDPPGVHGRRESRRKCPGWPPDT